MVYYCKTHKTLNVVIGIIVIGIILLNLKDYPKNCAWNYSMSNDAYEI